MVVGAGLIEKMTFERRNDGDAMVSHTAAGRRAFQAEGTAKAKGKGGSIPGQRGQAEGRTGG